MNALDEIEMRELPEYGGDGKLLACGCMAFRRVQRGPWSLHTVRLKLVKDIEDWARRARRELEDK